MAKIIPFRAVRATLDKAAMVTSRSYQDYSKAELKAVLNYNPFSFLHIINPGFKFNKKVRGYERFQLVRNRYNEFKEDGILVKENEASYYIYQKITPTHTFTGVIGAAATSDYLEGKIKKHEHTIGQREQLFKNYLHTTGFNAEAVLLFYKDRPTLNNMISLAITADPILDFTDNQYCRHKLWVLSNEEAVRKIRTEFGQITELYIGDGHHRTASSVLLSEELKDKNKAKTTRASDYFMSFLIPESQLMIAPFYRLVTDLNQMNPQDFLTALDRGFRIKNRGAEGYIPSKKHHFCMYLDGSYYSLYLRKDLRETQNVLEALDTQILFRHILKPLLGIDNLRNNKKIRYGYSPHQEMKIKTAVDSGSYAVGFTMRTAAISEIKAIADANLVMPPKSTWLEPKLPSALTIYQF